MQQLSRAVRRARRLSKPMLEWPREMPMPASPGVVSVVVARLQKLASLVPVARCRSDVLHREPGMLCRPAVGGVVPC